jgi:AcrR family transcriptional regulator
VAQRPHPRRRPTREQKRQANRERILAAARRVFGARGYQAATIEDIADQSGLSNGAIYYNFASKADLFLALLDDRMRERLDRTRAALAVDGGVEALRHALGKEAREITRTFKENPGWRLLMLEFVAYAARNREFGKRLAQHERELRAAVSEILDQHTQTLGRTAPLPTAQLALAITALLDGLALAELSDPGVVPDELFGELLAVLLTRNASPSHARHPKV